MILKHDFSVLKWWNFRNSDFECQIHEIEITFFEFTNYKFKYFLNSLLTLFSCEWLAISSADDEVVDSSANSLGGLAIVVVEAEDAVVEAKIEPWEAQCPLNREKNHCNK